MTNHTKDQDRDDQPPNDDGNDKDKDDDDDKQAAAPPSDDDNDDNADGFNIYIKMPCGTKTLTLKVEDDDTIDNVKYQIKGKAGIPPKHQQLLLKHQDLDGGKTLADYNIVKDTSLDLVMDISGGMGKRAHSAAPTTNTRGNVLLVKKAELNNLIAVANQVNIPQNIVQLARETLQSLNTTTATPITAAIDKITLKNHLKIKDLTSDYTAKMSESTMNKIAHCFVPVLGNLQTAQTGVKVMVEAIQKALFLNYTHEFYGATGAYDHNAFLKKVEKACDKELLKEELLREQQLKREKDVRMS